MHNLKLSVLIVAACALVTACNKGSSSNSSSGSGSTGGAEISAEVSALFEAEPDGSPASLDLANLPNALSDAFGAADDEPVAVNPGDDLANLLQR